MSALPGRQAPGNTALFLPEMPMGAFDEPPAGLPLAGEGVLRWAWESRFGSMLIEVMGDQIFVNGQRVEPHAP